MRKLRNTRARTTDSSSHNAPFNISRNIFTPFSKFVQVATMQFITLLVTLLSLVFVTAKPTLLPKDMATSRPVSSDGARNRKRADPAESSHALHAQAAQPTSSTEPVYVEQPGPTITSPRRLAIAFPRRLGEVAPQPMTAERLEAAQRETVRERQARGVLTFEQLAALRLQAIQDREAVERRMVQLEAIRALLRQRPGALTAEQIEVLASEVARTRNRVGRRVAD